MPLFIAIGYGDEAGYNRTPPEVRGRAHDHDEWLRRRGARMGPTGEPVQVRNTGERGVRRTQGAFMRSELPVAGFGIIEADDLEHAADLVTGTPCAVAHGVVEVWPVIEQGE